MCVLEDGRRTQRIASVVGRPLNENYEVVGSSLGRRPRQLRCGRGPTSQAGKPGSIDPRDRIDFGIESDGPKQAVVSPCTASILFVGGALSDLAQYKYKHK